LGHEKKVGQTKLTRNLA